MVNEKYRKELQKIKPMLERGDQVELARLSGLSEQSIYYYFAGKGQQTTTAIKIVRAARSLLATRQ